jgi:hypothetical protein
VIVQNCHENSVTDVKPLMVEVVGVIVTVPVLMLW